MNLPSAAVLLLSLLVYVALALDLQAPIHLHMDSVNFRYVLSWRPGPDTPPGASYIVSRKRWGGRGKKQLNTTSTSVPLRLRDPRDSYQLEVRAAFNHTVSPPATLHFTPCEHTTIGPPVVSLAGCGNCLQVNVSLPQPDPDARVDDLYTLLDPSFKVVYKKTGGEEATYMAEERNFTILNLQQGVEYCVQVHTLFRINHNTRPSNWTCEFSSTQQPSRDLVAIVPVAVLGMLILGALMTLMLCLHHTGFLCKLRALLPGSLLPILHQDYILMPETIVVNQVSVEATPTMGNRRQRSNPTVPQADTGSTDEEEEEEQEDEEEEEERDVYLNQPSKPASGDRSCENLREIAKDGEGQRQWEGPKEDVTPLDIHPALERSPDHVTEDEEKKKVEQDFCGDVDLFSVKLAPVAWCDQEKWEETGEEVGGACAAELHTDSSKSDDQTADEQEAGRTDNEEEEKEEWEEEEEEDEEEDEEVSAYLSHP